MQEDTQQPVTTPEPVVAEPVAAEPVVTVKSLSGFDEGEVLPDGEVVRGSYAEDGTLIGWHKEPATTEGSAE